MTTVYYYPQKESPPRLGALVLDSIQLIPGANSFSQGELEKLLAHPDYSKYEGKAIAVEESPSPEPSPEADDYSALADLSGFNIEGDESQVGAEDIVAEATDLDLLDKWLKAESRKTLQAIIQDRMEALA